MSKAYGDYPDLKGVKKILVIKLRHLGDVLLTTPLFHTLRRAFPEAEIDAYLYREAFPMLEGHPDIHRLIGYDRSWKEGGLWTRLKKETALLWEIRKNQYDLVLNLTEGDRGVIAAMVSRAKTKVGFPPKGKWQKKQLTHLVKSPHSARHTVERNLDLLRRIGIFPKPEECDLIFSLSERDRLKVQTDIGKSPFVLIHPTSRWRFKCWPVEKMRRLVETLVKQGERVVLTAGTDPVEKAMAEEICQGLDVLNLAGMVTLKELGACIEASKLLVCVDSLPLHLASAFKNRAALAL